MNWVGYYYEQGIISDKCATAWYEAIRTFEGVVDGDADPQEYLAARRMAMAFHLPTGDCYSDKIQYSYNPCRSMCATQLDRIVERDDRLARIARLEMYVRKVTG